MDTKTTNLKDFFAAHPKAALGLSGGVDSAFLLWAAVQSGAQVQPYFVKTAFQPRFELDDAQRLCRQLGVPLKVPEYDILARPEVAANPQNRCYHCKRALFGVLARAAAADGYTLLLDGTNASDQADDRPGMQALAELGVLSPLRLAGLTKADIRALSREAGLFTADKPAYACLATRVPAGRPLTAQLLAGVEEAEEALAALGFTDFRVRVPGDYALLQLPADQLPKAAQQHEAIRRALAPRFSRVLLDLAPRG